MGRGSIRRPSTFLINGRLGTWLNDAPKIPLDKYRFARWRCWKEYGTGVGGDLMVHLISGMLYTLGWNEPPDPLLPGWHFPLERRTQHAGSARRLFDYHGIPVYVRLGLGTETPELARFMGPKGILDAPARNFAIRRKRARIPSPAITRRVSGENARRIREPVARRARSSAGPRAG